MRRFLRHHGLSVAMLGLFFVTFLVGQLLVGRHEYNGMRGKRGLPPVGYGAYLGTSHFGETTAENWESEFLQMFVYVVATVFLYQKGSAESKDPDRKAVEPSRRAVRPDSPWPVRRGGWVLRLYRHSLSGALLVMFLVAFSWHARAGCRLYNEERVSEGRAPIGVSDYLSSSRFWFESFQNWQSEFLAIGAMVVLSIWLREAGSPESKQVETPHWENEE